MLLSGESLCDEIRAFEKASPLVRLAQTGYLVRKLRQLHEQLDAVVFLFETIEPDDLAICEKAQEVERAERIERFEMLLKVRMGDDVDGADVERDYDDMDDWDLTDKAFVEEVLTMLKAGVDKYAHDVLTQQEIRVIMAAFEAVSMQSNIVVLTTPEWFVSPFEFGGTYGLGRWGNDLLYSDNTDSKRFIVEANIWSGLNHPHIAKFLGACHVGSRPFFAHEKVRTLTEYLGALKATDRQAVWSRLYEMALGVRYLHERGFGCGQLGLESVYCARFEDKTLLLGIGLVKSGAELLDVEGESGLRANSLSKFVRDDIRSLFFCILDALSVLASSQEEHARILDKDMKETNKVKVRTLPTSRPQFVTESEWSLLQPMFIGESEVNMLVILDRLGSLAGNEERDAFDDMMSIDKQLDEQVIDLGKIVVLPNGMLLREVLEQCERLVVQEPSCAQVQTRLSDVLDAVHQRDLGGVNRNVAKAMVGHVCGLIVRFYRFLYQKSTSVASSQMGWNRREPAALFSFHTGIDHLMKQHGLSKADKIHNWQPEWHQLQASRQSIQIQPRLAGQLAPAHVNDDEGEMYCEFERTHHRTAYSKENNLISDSLRAESHEQLIDFSKRSSLPKWLIPPYEVDFNEAYAFGEGAFGSVHRGRWFETPVVVKRVSTDVENKRAVRQQFQREADVWYELNHINVIKMYGACHVGQPFFVCEYASGGEVMAFLEREGRNLYSIWYCLLNAALGLQYLHEAGVVHGDLKANNILVGTDGIVKLADFGLSLSTKARAQLGETCGAVGAYRWKAPECIPIKDDPGQSPTFASDVYSFAMCMIEVVSGEFPWGVLPDAAVKFQVKRGQLPKRPPEIGNGEWQLIERMCCFDPAKRVTIGAVVAHLSALIELFEFALLWISIGEPVPFKTRNNRVISRDGALLSLLKLATSTNARLAKRAGIHLLAVHINRGARSGIQELELIVKMLRNESVDIQSWAAEAIQYLCWNNEDNAVAIAAAGGISGLVALIYDGKVTNREYAAGALVHLSLNDDNKVAIAAAGGIPALVVLIRDGNDTMKQFAAAAFYSLSMNAENAVAIAAAGGIPPLVALIRDGNDIMNNPADLALYSLSTNAEHAVAIAAAGGIPALVALIQDSNNAHKTIAVATLQNLLMNTENAVNIAAAGGIPALVALIRNGSEDQKDIAAAMVRNLSIIPENAGAIAAAGGIPALVTLIRNGNDEQKTNATIVLGNLCVNDENAVSIAAAGGIPAMVALLRDGNNVQKEIAFFVVANLYLNDDNAVAITAAGGIPAVVALIRDDINIQKELAANVLVHLCVNEETAVAIAAAGGIPALVAMIRDGSEIQKNYAALALRTLCVNDENAVAIAAAGGIPVFVALIREGSEDQKEIAAGTLRNLSINDENAVAISAADGIPALVASIRDGNGEQKEHAAVALGNLSVNAVNKTAIAAAGGIPALMTLIHDGNEMQKKNATAALCKLSNNANTMAIASAGAIPPLVDLVRDGDDEQKLYSAGVLWNLAYFNDALRPSIIAHGAVKPLLHVVQACTTRSRAMAAGALSFLDVDESVKADVIAHGGIAALLEELVYPNSKDEVLVALMNLCAGNGANVRSRIEEANGVSILSALAAAEDDRIRELSIGILAEVGFA